MGGRGAECPPRDFWPGNFCWPTGKKEARKKGKRGENWEEKKENCKREGGKVTKWGEDLRTFFFFFFFLLLTFQTTKICFGSTKMEIFYREKAFHAGKKKSGQMTLPPHKNFPVKPLDNNAVQQDVFAITQYEDEIWLSQ